MIPAHYKPLRTKAWLRQLTAEDRKAFSTLGYMACAERGINLPSLGGSVSSKTNKRDERGRFMKCQK